MLRTGILFVGAFGFGTLAGASLMTVGTLFALIFLLGIINFVVNRYSI